MEAPRAHKNTQKLQNQQSQWLASNDITQATCVTPSDQTDLYAETPPRATTSRVAPDLGLVRAMITELTAPPAIRR